MPSLNSPSPPFRSSPHLRSHTKIVRDKEGDSFPWERYSSVLLEKGSFLFQGRVDWKVLRSVKLASLNNSSGSTRGRPSLSSTGTNQIPNSKHFSEGVRNITPWERRWHELEGPFGPKGESGPPLCLLRIGGNHSV